MAFTTSGQETEWALFLQPGAHTGHSRPRNYIFVVLVWLQNIYANIACQNHRVKVKIDHKHKEQDTQA